MFLLVGWGVLTGRVSLGGVSLDANNDGVVNAGDLKYCVANHIDCDYAGIITYIKGVPLGAAESCTTEELVALDANGDCTITDFELLDAIDLWSAGQISDFCLLDGINYWSGASIPGCGGGGCTETDGGKNYFEAGTVTGQTTGYGVGEAGISDKCADSTYLLEYYCDSAEHCSQDFYACPNGCVNGACVTTISTTTLPTTTVPTTTIPAPSPPVFENIWSNFINGLQVLWNMITGW